MPTVVVVVRCIVYRYLHLLRYSMFGDLRYIGNSTGDAGLVATYVVVVDVEHSGISSLFDVIRWWRWCRDVVVDDVLHSLPTFSFGIDVDALFVTILRYCSVFFCCCCYGVLLIVPVFYRCSFVRPLNYHSVDYSTIVLRSLRWFIRTVLFLFGTVLECSIDTIVTFFVVPALLLLLFRVICWFPVFTIRCCTIWFILVVEIFVVYLLWWLFYIVILMMVYSIVLEVMLYLPTDSVFRTLLRCSLSRWHLMPIVLCDTVTTTGVDDSIVVFIYVHYLLMGDGLRKRQNAFLSTMHLWWLHYTITVMRRPIPERWCCVMVMLFSCSAFVCGSLLMTIDWPYTTISVSILLWLTDTVVFHGRHSVMPILTGLFWWWPIYSAVSTDDLMMIFLRWLHSPDTFIVVVLLHSVYRYWYYNLLTGICWLRPAIVDDVTVTTDLFQFCLFWWHCWCNSSVHSVRCQWRWCSAGNSDWWYCCWCRWCDYIVTLLLVIYDEYSVHHILPCCCSVILVFVCSTVFYGDAFLYDCSILPYRFYILVMHDLPLLVMRCSDRWLFPTIPRCTCLLSTVFCYHFLVHLRLRAPLLMPIWLLIHYPFDDFPLITILLLVTWVLPGITVTQLPCSLFGGGPV